MDYKSFPVEIVKADTKQGIIDAVVAVMGNIDHGNDIIHTGAFTKTLNERGNKIKVLDNHNTNSLKDVIGKPLSIREIGENELPISIKSKYPDATGGLYTVTQFDMDDEHSRTIFNKLANGFVNEWSIGFTIPKGKQDYSEGMVRNIREVILFEYSPVIWGMNEATDTIGAKNMSEGETKKRSIIQTYIDITDSFHALYMNWDEYTGFMVNDVFTDGTLVCKSCNMETEYNYYQVGWMMLDNQFVFDPIEDWQGGNFSFVIGLKSYDIIEETKQGRVLSQRNYDKIKNACDMLMEVMSEAMPMMDDETEPLMSMSDTPDLEVPANDNPDELAKSGKPLTKNRDERLAEINQLIKSLDNLGVH